MSFSGFKGRFSSFILFIFLICSQKGWSQDTIFIKAYQFDEPVFNIDGMGEYIIARTPSKIYRLNEDDEFEEIKQLDTRTAGKHSWIGQRDRRGNYTTYETDYLPPAKQVPYYPVGQYLPGYHHANITMAIDGDNFYVTFRGGILKYQVKRFYKIKNRWESVRNIFIDDSIKITSTNSAIYRDSAYDSYAFDTIRGVAYSDGEANKIGNHYYLCSSDLFRLGKKGWERIAFLPTSSQNFRKLSVNKNQSYYMTINAFGKIDLSHDVIIDTLLWSPKKILYDVAWVNNSAYLCSEDGNLYILKNDKLVTKVSIGSEIYDINISPDNSFMILSCRNGVFKMDIADQKVEKLYDLTQAMQTVFVDGELIIATLHGMYFVYDEKLSELIPRIEFNKYGLLAYKDFIYAGSIEGLYIIDKGILLNDIAKSLKSQEFKNNKELFYKWGIAFLCLIILISPILIYYYRKKRKDEIFQPRKSSIINPDSIRRIVLENPTLVSVESIADYFETSTVQLNRILKKYNTSGLAVLKSIKQDIVKEMIAQQKSMEEISRRVGYSTAYIKRNLL
jgi:hypothetical protein